MPNVSMTLVCQVFYPDSQATSVLLTDLLSALCKNGSVFRVVAGLTPNEKGGYPARRELHCGIEIHRVGIPLPYKRGLILRAVHYGCFLVGSAIELWRLRKNTHVVCVTNPPMVPAWIWFLSKCFLKRYTVILHDVYPEVLVAMGILREDSLPARLWRWANTKALQNAEHVVVLGRDMFELVQERYGVAKKRIAYIPHCSPFVPQVQVAAQDTNLCKELGLNGKFIIQYSGNMGLLHDIEIIVRAADLLKERSHIHFLMIGDGMRKRSAQDLAEKLQLRNMTWLPFQPKATLQDSLSCCHIALISQRKGLQGVAVPCKLYGILASGRAIVGIVPKGCEIDRVIQEEDCGVVLHSESSEHLAGVILSLSGDVPRVLRFGCNGFAAYQRNYTINSAVEKFESIWTKRSKFHETDCSAQ